MIKLVRSEDPTGKPDKRIDSEVWQELAEGLQESLSFNSNKNFSDNMICRLNKVGKDVIVLSRKLNTASNGLKENAILILADQTGKKTPELMEYNRVAFISVLSQINDGIDGLNKNVAQLIEIVNKEGDE